MPLKQIKTSYNAGELSAYMDGRTDINKYHNGCSKLINALVLPHGGFTKRPGTEYIATAAGRANLIPFEFSVDDALILEFSEDLLRFYKSGAIVNDNVGYEDLSGVDALVAHWLLNEDEGVTVVNDDDAGTYDGTATVDCSTLHADGKVGSGCFDLDGLYTVEIADADAFSFTSGSADTAFSIACWAYVTQGGLQILLSKWRDQSTTREWRFSLNNERKLQLHLADISEDLASIRVAQWKLNEADTNKTVLDDTTNDHDGLTQTDDTTDLSETGKIDKCLNFGGADCVVITTAHNDLSFGDGSADEEFSIAAWIYVTNSSSEQQILSKYDGTTGSLLREWCMFLDSSEYFRFVIYDEDVPAKHWIRASNALTTGWHFVVATYSGVGGAFGRLGLELYVDGVPVSNSIGSVGTYVAMVNTNTTVKIGAIIGAGGTLTSFFQDKIDNVCLFNVELSEAQVSALWNEGAGTENLAGVSATPYTISNDAINEGWHFLACTYSAPADERIAANGILLYVDGVKVDSTPINDTDYVAMEAGDEAIRIGSQNGIGGADEKFWEDKIDEVSIFSDVLDPEEIASLYSVTPYSIVSPYTSDEAFEIHVTQSADVMYIAHEDHHPQKLSRYGDLNWTIEDVDFKGGPFLDENTTAASYVGFARLGGTAMSGYYFPTGATGTLTATGTDNDPFNSNMVGALWLVKHTRDVDNDTDTFAQESNIVPAATTYATGAIYIKGDATVTFEPIATTEMAQLWRKEGNGKWQTYRSFRASSSFSWTEDADDVLYAMTRDAGTISGTLTAKEAVNRGVVKITGFTSSTVVTVEVIDKVISSGSGDGAVTTPMWAEGAWSDYRGYPRTVAFFEDRLWWASSTNNPDTLWGSKTGQYENMEYTDLGVDDDAIIAPILDNEVSQIQWMMARQVMAVGAANKEYRFGASNPDDAVTPADRKATPQTGFGSGEIQPVILNDTIFFFQRTGKKLGAMKFDSITENFDVDDATLLAYGLFDSAPTNMAVQRVPDSIIWTVRTDGILPTFSYEPTEEVAGWARQLFGNSSDVDVQTGYVESAAVIHGSAEDEIWVCVRRDIGGTVYYIEKFKPRNFGSDIKDACFVDSGTTTTTTNTTDTAKDIGTLAEGIIAGTVICGVTTHGYSTGDIIIIAGTTNYDGTYTITITDVSTFYFTATYEGDETAAGTATKVTAVSIEGLSHLKGESVKAFIDGETVTVGDVNSSGISAITLSLASAQYTTVQIGLGYTMKARTMRLAVPPPNTLQSRIKRIHRTVVRYVRSLKGSAGQEYSGVEYLGDIEATYSTASQDTPKDNRLTSGGFNEDAYTVIVSDDPVPFTCLATIIDVEI